MEYSAQDTLAFQLKQFGKAITAFELAVAQDEGDVKSRNSLLLSYVFTFEMTMKALRAALVVRGLETPDYATAVLKAAFRARLIDDPSLWELLRDQRNDVSHAYDEGKAIVIAAYVREFAGAAFHAVAQRLEHDDA